ncbi:hypothetical protein N7450_005262 [Penicillium hetheringtonii]|uniref:Mitochondrial thiamine pyrophosphate carrier 1 n=1 Tax=Penicillium hetheringtonii TaxID=911720 RepID=A0AAD6DRJ7_9EURO|nr:hypothetical protein N7450_005262 [Penicillium hetheringtonii]
MAPNNHIDPWKSVLSGTGAAILANFLVYPLDIVKTRLQVHIQHPKTDISIECGSDNDQNSKNIWNTVLKIIQEDGVQGLYHGLESSMLGTASMNFAYFYWSAVARTIYREILQARGLSGSNSIVKELGLGAAGGAMAQLCTTPISTISTRQQVGKRVTGRRSMWACTKAIVGSDDGWTGLWTGLKVNLILVVNPMITYGVYQWLRNILLNVKKELGSFDAFLLGALSKIIATIVTHPLIVAKTTLQSKSVGHEGGKPFKGFTDVLIFIFRNEGFLRLYKGLVPQITKGFLVQGLMMLFKERMETLLVMATKKLAASK